MAAILENKKCTACEGRHTLFLPTGNMSDHRKQYEYDCPASGAVVHLETTDANWWKTIDVKPKDAVVVREVG